MTHQDFVTWGKSVAPHTRWWIDDDQFERLALILAQDSRVYPSYEGQTFKIYFRHNIVIYPKSARGDTAFPNREPW